MQQFEADVKGKNGTDVGVFFLLGNGMNVESLWHLSVVFSSVGLSVASV